MDPQTISIMLGKGSLNHNNRTFIADNVDKNRTHLNTEFKNEDIKEAYHKLFDEALMKYNSKQKRTDRIIDDYYEKIRTGKQEKLFHEIVVQIGSKDTMNAKSSNGKLAQKILTEYMESFISRNSNLYVFSAHLHMDEETPHLHIDFIPFTTNSNRGLETRVSLKKAMEKQGFIGKGRQETELHLWIEDEKIQLSNHMLKHQIKWKKLNTHNEHLSVYEYKKQERIKEVNALEKKIDVLDKKLQQYEDDDKTVLRLTDDINDELWKIPEPKRFMSAATYKRDFIEPFVKKIRVVVRRIIRQYLDMTHEIGRLRTSTLPLSIEIRHKEEIIERLKKENRKYSMEINKVKSFLGIKTYNEILNKPKEKNKNVKEYHNR